MGKPPADPFSGKSLRYRPDKDRYVIWSVGPDGGDDMGKIAYDPTNGTLSSGDLVFSAVGEI